MIRRKRFGPILKKTTLAELEVELTKQRVDLAKIESQFTRNPIEQWGVDPKLTERYAQRGLSYMSTAGTNRDRNGNIVLYSDKENQKLPIEPVTQYYSNQSVLKNIDTKFTYFEFPPILNVNQTRVDNVDLSGLTDELEEQLINARFIPNPETQWFSFEINPGRLNFDTSVQGLTQAERSTYTITPDIIRTGKDLEFFVRIACHHGSNLGSNITYESTFELRAANYRPTPSGIPISRILIQPGGYDLLEMRYIIKNQDMQEFDKWFIKGNADNGNDAYYFSDQSYWQVQLIEPGTGVINYGRQITAPATVAISEVALNSILYIQNNQQLIKVPGTAEAINSGLWLEEIYRVVDDYIELEYSETNYTGEQVVTFVQNELIKTIGGTIYSLYNPDII